MTEQGSGLDCLIVGAGPAGLSAALYLARFKRAVGLVDDGHSRAKWIPSSRNIVFFGEGIAGTDILKRGRSSISGYGVKPRDARVARLRKAVDGFSAEVIGPDGTAEEISSKFVLLATGAVDRPPEIDDCESAVRDGVLRYCPVCDGFEASDQRVAVLGQGSHGVKEAEFLVRSGFGDVTLLSFRAGLRLAADERTSLGRLGIKVIADPVRSVEQRGSVMVARAGDQELTFETMYSALGLKARCELALSLGAACDGSGALVVDRHYETSVPGLFAAGDIVSGLNQVVVAMGHAAVAATEIHNRLDVPARRS